MVPRDNRTLAFSTELLNYIIPFATQRKSWHDGWPGGVCNVVKNLLWSSKPVCLFPYNIYILIIHWSLFGYLWHDWLLPIVSFDKAHSLQCPQRDVLSDKMVFWVVTHSFYFMLCQSSLLSTVISFVYNEKWWFDESMSVISGWKIFEKNSFIPSPHWIKLENFVMQLKRQSIEVWQNEKDYSKGNNTSENPIPRQEISNQSTMWSTKVRSGHNICCLCSFLLELSNCRVTYENCYKSSVSSINLRNANGFELRNSYFTTV